MKIVIADNYDSFTHNLAHLAAEVTGTRPQVIQGDKITPELAAGFDKIIISPGPGLPEDAGNSIAIIKALAASHSILGVCLGHQALATAFGGEVVNLEKVYHGIASELRITDRGEPLFSGLPERFSAGRYHSWVVARENLPGCFTVTCEDEEGRIMGISHKEYDLRGVQFHPESILTQYGYRIMKNWIELER